MIRVLIAAAYASVRAGLRSLLSEAPEVELISVVSGSGELARVICDARADVVVADDDTSDRGSLLRLAADAEVALVLLTDDRAALSQLISAGLVGWACLLRDADGAEIAASIHAAAAGLVTMDRSLLPAVAPGLEHPRSQIVRELPDPMTARELQVLQLLAQGLPNKVIANRLQISQHTVKFHVAAILSKLNAGSRTEAVTLGARRGLVTF